MPNTANSYKESELFISAKGKYKPKNVTCGIFRRNAESIFGITISRVANFLTSEGDIFTHCYVLGTALS